MEFLHVYKEAGLAFINLCRGKVNALNEPMMEEIGSCFSQLETDDSVKTIVFSGTGKFFSFGFDIPEFLTYSKEEFFRHLSKFVSVCTQIYLFPKPVVAALNGHTMAAGCILALACDYRIMVSGKARISINEINLGASVDAGTVEMLRCLVGGRNAERILFSGAMYSAEEAERFGLVDKVVDEANLREEAAKIAGDFSAKAPAAFRSIKRLLRGPVAEKAAAREESSMREFVDIWYSEQTRKKMSEIEIRT